jgi:hypothetical protein
MQICREGKHHTTTSAKIFLLLATTLSHPDLESFLQGRSRQQGAYKLPGLPGPMSHERGRAARSPQVRQIRTTTTTTETTTTTTTTTTATTIRLGRQNAHYARELSSSYIYICIYIYVYTHLTFKPKKTNERDTPLMGLCLLPSAMPERRP